MLRDCIRNIMDFVVPPVCPVCGEEIFKGEDFICPECEAKMPLLPERICHGCGGANDTCLNLCRECLGTAGGRPWRIAVTAFPFYGELRHSIHRYKYRGRFSIAPYFARKMYESWMSQASNVPLDFVTYIPLHLYRYLWRGYNQSALLARMLAEKLGIEYRGVLLRGRVTQQQAKLDMQKRLKNMKEAFDVLDEEVVRGKNILLVDDVFTTGATLTSATEKLLQAGANEVSVITIARD